MNPSSGQVSPKWGDPAFIQQFRTDALSKGLGRQQVDDYISQYTNAYATQQKNAIQNTSSGAQGGMTTGQAATNPVAASQFLNSGGQLTPAGPDAQAIFINQAQKLFASKKDKSGFVAPDLFNKTKEAASQLGIAGDTFDKTFEQGGFVDPNKTIYYNTADGLQAQKDFGEIKRKMEGLINQYNNIPADQKGLFSKAQAQDIPFLGQILAPQAASYDKSRKGLSAELGNISGGGAGSGLRVTQAELNNWSGLLPDATKTDAFNHKQLEMLNTQIKSKYNTPTGLDPSYLPSKGRAPLKSIFGF